ncbi:MAG: Type 1 glutamine amidotransferase-like domain-containing protein, partial [Flavobacterium sp.]
MQKTKAILLFCFLYLCYPLFAQPIGRNNNGIEIITSGGKVADSLFIQLLGNSKAKLIFIPTAASSLRSETGTIWNPDEVINKKEFKQDLSKRFHLEDITILHTRDNKEANTESFSKPLKDANAVWISGGNPGRFMSVYKGTLFEKELKNFLQRGGIIAGESAGAIVQGSYTIRGNPDKPVLMVEGSEKGLGLLENIAINPHLSAQKRENE